MHRSILHGPNGLDRSEERSPPVVSTSISNRIDRKSQLLRVGCRSVPCCSCCVAREKGARERRGNFGGPAGRAGGSIYPLAPFWSMNCPRGCCVGARWPTPPHVQRAAPPSRRFASMDDQIDGASPRTICLPNCEGPRPPAASPGGEGEALVVAAHKWSLLSWPTAVGYRGGGTIPSDQCGESIAWRHGRSMRLIREHSRNVARVFSLGWGPPGGRLSNQGAAGCFGPSEVAASHACTHDDTCPPPLRLWTAQ